MQDYEIIKQQRNLSFGLNIIWCRSFMEGGDDSEAGEEGDSAGVREVLLSHPPPGRSVGRHFPCTHGASPG